MLHNARRCEARGKQIQLKAMGGELVRGGGGFNGLVCVGDLSFAHVKENKVVLTSTGCSS